MSELLGSGKFDVVTFYPHFVLAVAIIFSPENFAHLNLVLSHTIFSFFN